MSKDKHTGHGCNMCEEGTLDWDSMRGTYHCTSCDFEASFSRDKPYPTYFLKGKHFLGSFISRKRGESDLEARLRKLHQEISLDEEWTRRKEHYDKLVDDNCPFVLKYWDSKSDFIEGYAEKSKLALEITRGFNLPLTAVCDILNKEDRFRGAVFRVWGYRLTVKHGDVVAKIWNSWGGDRIIKKDSIKITSILKQIGNKLNITEYGVSTILQYKGLLRTGNWNIWTNSQIEMYGQMILNMWENRKHSVKKDDKWGLCEVIEGISKDTGDIVNPYVVTNILANQKAVNLDPHTAYTAYSEYKNAKLALDSIVDLNRPLTATDVSKELGIGKRVAHKALRRLREQGLVKMYHDRTNHKYHYVEGQEDILRSIAINLKQEDEILNSGTPYVTRRDVEGSQTIVDKYFKRWKKEGKVVEIPGFAPTIYAVVNGQSEDAAIKNALQSRCADVLSALNEDSLLAKELAEKLSLSVCTAHSRLNLLETHGLVAKDNFRYSNSAQ